VVAVRDLAGRTLGCIVNYACHPTHHGGAGAISGGYPGVLASAMKARGCPVTLFLNGACGNLHTSDPCREGADMTMDEAGSRLAADATKVMGAMIFRREARLTARSATVRLPYRTVTEAEAKGAVRGAQRFVDPAIYDRHMPDTLERISQRGTQPAEVQVLFMDEYAFASIPAEYFVQLGLRIKEESWPCHAVVVSHANGMVGYVPHKEAFLRGGYETTFGGHSRLAPEAGDMLADCAIGIIRAQG